MQKYTAKDIAEQKISFNNLNRSQFDKLVNHFNKYYNKLIDPIYYSSDRYFRFYIDNANSYFYSRIDSYLTHPQERLQSTREITFEEFDFEEEFVLPVSWYIEVNKSNYEILSKYYYTFSGRIPSLRIDVGDILAKSNYGHLFLAKCTLLHFLRSYPGFKSIISQQFKKYVLMENNKEIIGYLVPYTINVVGTNPWLTGEIAVKNIFKGRDIDNYCMMISPVGRGTLPKEIVEKWEPVYKEEPELVPFTFEDRKLLRGKWIKRKETNNLEESINRIAITAIGIDDRVFSYETLLKEWVFIDGSPCGKLTK